MPYYFKLAKLINLTQSLAILIICFRILLEKERDFCGLVRIDELHWQVAFLLFKTGTLKSRQ
jgi:hypothetical protein